MFWSLPFFFEGNERIVLRSAIAGKIRLVGSSELMEELIRVFDLKFHLDSEVLAAYIFGLSRTVDLVKTRRLSDSMVRDRKDVKVLECSVAGHCSHIVTGDGDLLSLGSYRSIKILNSTGLLKALKAGDTIFRVKARDWGKGTENASREVDETLYS